MRKQCRNSNNPYVTTTRACGHRPADGTYLRHAERHIRSSLDRQRQTAGAVSLVKFQQQQVFSRLELYAHLVLTRFERPRDAVIVNFLAVDPDLNAVVRADR